MKVNTPPPPTRVAMVDENGYVTDLWSEFFDRLYSNLQVSPVGGIALFGGADTPNGWLLCDGSAVSKKKFDALYASIGGAFGESADTFNLPDFSDKFVRGGATIGDTGGADEVMLDLTMLPEVDVDITDPGHDHEFMPITHHHDVSTGAGTGGIAVGGTGTLVPTSDTEADGTVEENTTGITAKLLGGGEPVPTVPEYIVMAYIIKY